MEPETEAEGSGPSTAARIRPAPETRPASHPVGGGGGGGSGGEAPADGADGRGGVRLPAADDSMGRRSARARAVAGGGEAEGRNGRGPKIKPRRDWGWV